MKMEKEDLFKKRILDLARIASQRGIVTYTDFLDMYELHMVHSLRTDGWGVSVHVSGGYEESERQIAAFQPDALSFEIPLDFPIECLNVSPRSRKFAETLTHRDYLGALVHLGIQRSMLGDLLVQDQEAYVFCHRRMKDFLIENLTRIRHTEVCCRWITEPEDLPAPRYQEIRGTVASVRLDSVIALAFSSSRSSMLGLIQGGKVFVNGKLVTSNGHPLKPEDVVSVRGYGKFRFMGTGGLTKKGRCSVTINRFV